MAREEVAGRVIDLEGDCTYQFGVLRTLADTRMLKRDRPNLIKVASRMRSMGTLTLLILATGCGSDRTSLPNTESVDGDGVVIRALGSDTAGTELTLERVGELALPDSGWVVEADGVAVDAEGERIYVLDEMGPRLLVFALDGTLVGQVGRAGEGPGEFAMPSAVDVDAQGVVRLVDGGRSLVLSWDREGRFLRQDRLEEPYWGPGFQVNRGGLLYVRGDEGAESANFTEVLMRVAEEGVSELVQLTQEWVQVESGCGRIPLPRLMAPSLIWHANARYVVATAWPDYSLRVFEGDSLAAILSRDFPPLRVTERQAEETVSQGPLGFLVESCGMTAAEVTWAAGFLELASPIDRVAVDPLNRIWTRTNIARGDASRIEILDLEQGYLGYSKASAFPAAFVSPERFVSIADRDWGSSVEIWRIREGS